MALLGAAVASSPQAWPQWAQNPRHTGNVSTSGQPARRVLADLIYDPFTAQEAADPPAPADLRVHYQPPLVMGDDVFMEFKTGTYTGIATWESQVWNEKRLHWQGASLTTGPQGSAWDSDVVNSWLVKATAGGSVAKATYASLVPGAPRANDPCLGVFATAELPWPPSPDAVPPTLPCGSVRTALNLAPAVAPDGTILVAAVHHFNSRTAYLLAIYPDLAPKWQTSLRDRFNDGCNVYLPPNGSPGGCRVGAHPGVDPAQNRPGAGRASRTPPPRRRSPPMAASSSALPPATTGPRGT